MLLYWSRLRFRLFSRRDESSRQAECVAHRGASFGNEKALARRNEVVKLFVTSIVKNLLLQELPQSFDQIQIRRIARQIMQPNFRTLQFLLQARFVSFNRQDYGSIEIK